MNILIHPSYFANIAHFVAMVRAERISLEMDDNFQKQTYRNRCYIYGANGKLSLNIPIIHTQKERQKYRDVRILNEDKWQSQHWKSIQSAYRTSPFFEFYEDELKPLFESVPEKLMDYNLNCFEVICNCLQLDFNISKISTYQKAPLDLIDYRALVNAKKEPIFAFEPYTQVFSNKHGFLSNLSILDLLCNEGPNALNYLESQSISL